MRPTFSTKYASTGHIPFAQRLEYWEAYNAAELVGLRCSSLSARGLLASQTNFFLRNMHFADIRGNNHVIERNPSLVLSFPKESIFVSRLMEGEAYFIQDNRCILMAAGETIVYDTRKPYLFGFLDTMRQFLLDIPVSVFSEQLGIDTSRLPLKLACRTGTEAMLGATLHKTLLDFLSHPTDDMAEPFVDHVGTLLASMIHCHLEGPSASRSSLSYLLTARHYISHHLGDPELAPQTAADAVGLSVRHLSRLFAAEGKSLASYIWALRTERAYADLKDPMLRNCSIGEIAFKWGFSSQAHFARTMRSRFGAAPSEIRMAGQEQVFHPAE